MSYAVEKQMSWRTLAASVATICLVCACSGEVPASAKFSSSEDAGASLTATVTRLTSQPWSAGDVARIAGISISRYYGSLLADATDVPLVFNGRTVGNAHTALAAAAPTFAVLFKTYGTLGALLAAQEQVDTPNLLSLDTMFDSLAGDYGAKSSWFKTAAVSASTPAYLATEDRVAPPKAGAAWQDRVNFAALTALSGLGPTVDLKALGLVITQITPNLCTELHVWPAQRQPRPRPNPNGNTPRYNPFANSHAAVKIRDVDGQSADVGGPDYFAKLLGPPTTVIQMP